MDGAPRKAHYFSGAGGGVLSIAGLWGIGASPRPGTRSSAERVVTAANTFAGTILNRMPVFLEPGMIAPWLDGAAGPEILKPASEDLLRVWPVSKRVNKPATMTKRR